MDRRAKDTAYRRKVFSVINERIADRRKVERRVILECINSHCGNSGAFPTGPDGEPEQCQFCYTEPRLVFSQANYENNRRGNDRRQV